jgi:sterol desaturase/sphingolipid hydroxylase (fatty acid hydroxylase superfamily)
MSAASLPTRLRAKIAESRAADRAAEGRATVEVERDEAALANRKRRSLSLAAAWRQFWNHPSPWIIAVTLAAALVARVLVGGFGMSDVVVALLMVASFPLVEWCIHVAVLHLRPKKLGPVTFDLLLARKHREHHADPRDLPLIFIPTQVLLFVLASQVLMVLFVFPALSVGLSYLLTLSVIGMTYEWTHYLIHTDYRPVSKGYRALWRNHRLHHYKNERYWFSLTTSGTSDRLFGTYPDPSETATSLTARDLLGAG